MNDHEHAILRHLTVRGRVQGVGFRPCVFRLATQYGLSGFVANTERGAIIEIAGPPSLLESFERDLLANLPPLAHVATIERADKGKPHIAGRESAVGHVPSFRIVASHADSTQRPEVTPDAATCRECLQELRDPADRRHGYPFINCTNCGPRYSIIRSVPYDRPQTTMADFTMCPACAAEYTNPADRRFHAQPVACPACGPQVRLVAIGETTSSADASREGDSLAPLPPREGPREGRRSVGADALQDAAALLARGGILAVKGLGGYHLACRADDDAAVRRLRQRKLRDGKPLALMVADLEVAKRLCHVTAADATALCSVAAPIVLMAARDRAGARSASPALSSAVAPGCHKLGVMLPYTPLHHLLFDALRQAVGRAQAPLPCGEKSGEEQSSDESPTLPRPLPAGEGSDAPPLVMTSANLSGQPLTYRDDEARSVLSDVADAYFVHDRAIFRPIDDSVVFTFRDEVVPLRRARGYAPAPLYVAGFAPGEPLHALGERQILATGGDLKSAVCLLARGQAVLSEHLGDLSGAANYRHYVDAVARLETLCGVRPDIVAVDLHPQYLATQYGRERGLPVIAVQHHHAHIASVMAEWGVVEPVIGIACDGTGYGTDGAIWGGELLLCERGTFERLGHLPYFPLVGGDAAARETWRPAAAVLQAAGVEHWTDAVASAPFDDLPNKTGLRLFDQQGARGINAPPTSSLGRVFDAVAFLLGLCAHNRHEAEAAMALEAAAAAWSQPAKPLPYTIDAAPAAPTSAPSTGLWQLSLLPAIRELVAERRRGASAAELAARFHETVARLFSDAARRSAEERNVRTAALSGGCFANCILLARMVTLLEDAGLRVLYHRRVPSGDGGLALGQAWVAAWTGVGPASGRSLLEGPSPFQH